MKKEIKTNKFKKIFNNINLFKKYNYNINEVVGVKDNEKYILYVDKKLIRIYRGPLKSAPLICSSLLLEDAIFYNFEIEKNVINKVDISSFIETKVYEEAGIDETEEYEIKYKIVDKLKDDKYVIIETVIVPISKINQKFEYILKETGYIDYISFPAFSYKALYEEQILKKANDIFVVILFDKIFLTYYSDGDLIGMTTVSGGLDKIYESLAELKIKGYDEELFKKLITKKGLSIGKYSSNELIVLEKLKKSFSKIASYLTQEINKIKDKYNIIDIDRIFITSEYGDIEGIGEYLESVLDIQVNNFEFYEKYNLDRLPIDPFLFLGMLETHYAYKFDNQEYNFSQFLRKPTFFYRPSGIFLLTSIIVLLALSAYPLYLFINGKIFENKNKFLNSEISNLMKTNIKLNSDLKKLQKQANSLDKRINLIKQEISYIQSFIKDVYKFKFSYLPKSQELVDITYLMNKNKVYAKIIKYNNGIYEIKVFSYKETNIPNLVKDLTDNGFSVDFDKIEYKNGKYNSIIRIKE
ncbi:hypothetical protein FE773_03500 [Caminibacter mediatlanticus TB-2]|uniref:Uncharacterized protein n=1 Tax=Caminibacter mediatlanticus TB-2 TaxID=391592 RepID=A0ABX5V7R6_9BACT|nr:hypothetical protein [Caminibacter mediatlanticus]QCT94276.1 hypothetical protein FE773_03500 [Caminibacter mediatlanticus TB-2]